MVFMISCTKPDQQVTYRKQTNSLLHPTTPNSAVQDSHSQINYNLRSLLIPLSITDFCVYAHFFQT